VCQIWVSERCVCVRVCVSGLCLREICVLLLFGFRFAGMGVVVFLACFVSVLWFLLIVVVCSFGFCWLSGWQGVARFLCWGCLLLVRLLARFHCIVYVAVDLSWMRCLVLRTSSWPGCSRLVWSYVLWFLIFTPWGMQVCVHAG